MRQSTLPFAWPLVLFIAVSLACNFPSPANAPQNSTGPGGASTETVNPTTSPEAAPGSGTDSGRLLTICMGQEPSSLFLYADASAAARNIRQAIYDGPFDVVGFDYSPVILESKPTQAAGDVLLEPIPVQPGSPVVDVTGKLTNLGEGVQILPAGCNDPACAITFTGTAPAQMEQMVVRTKLRAGLTWSDGEPLTADDSLYAYEVARSLYPRVRAELIDRTQSYQALDAQTVEWRGVPGFRDPSYPASFFTPLPRHAWGEIPAAELAGTDRVSRTPIGWGPYAIQEWTAGDHITLIKNPSYFRAPEGLPAFDRLVFRFMPDRDQGLAALLAGECDLLDETNHLEIQGAALLDLQEKGQAAVSFQPAAAWEHADFGILPYNPPEAGGLLPLFGSKEIRQAIALCTDRQRMASELFFGQSAVPDSYVPASHPLFNPDGRKYAFDPAAGATLLDSIGWVDTDNDPASPRIAQGVAGIPDGTALEFTFLTTGEDEKQRAAAILQESLTTCGIKMNISTQPAENLFAPGPEGVLFGRNFNFAQFGWVSAIEPPCYLYTSQQIPGPYPEYSKGWGGANPSGYSNPDFDRACQQALLTLPEMPEHRAAHFLAQAIYTEDLPAIPLYQRLKLVATRPDFCGVTLDSSTESGLWNLESFNYGADCVP
jgi:peptide/nickel transport system substrate-binding protein